MSNYPNLIVLNKVNDDGIIDTIVLALKEIFDPEIPIDIFTLGLIYEIHIDVNYKTKVIMTLTSPNCPEAESLPSKVKEKVESIEKINGCEVSVVFDPVWSLDMVPEDIKIDLGII